MGVRLHFIVEGQTEETFVNRVLRGHLANHDIWCDAHCVTTNRQYDRARRGGLVGYAQARRDIELWMKQDRRPDAAFTTMFDLYALPHDFPGYAETRHTRDPFQRVAALEQALAQHFYYSVAPSTS